MVDQHLRLQRDARRKQAIVVAQHFDEFAARVFYAAQYVVLQPQALWISQVTNRVSGLYEGIDNVADLVAWRIVTDDDLYVFVGLGQRTFQCLTEEARVEGRDDDADEGALIHGAKL